MAPQQKLYKRGQASNILSNASDHRLKTGDIPEALVGLNDAMDSELLSAVELELALLEIILLEVAEELAAAGEGEGEGGGGGGGGGGGDGDGDGGGGGGGSGGGEDEDASTFTLTSTFEREGGGGFESPPMLQPP